MISVILLMIPLTLPKVFGIKIYGVLTGSMTPAYSIGGVVYVKEENPENIQVGDVITYGMGSGSDYVMTHRVVEVQKEHFITKGDANDAVDPEPVRKDRLIGKVIYFLPGMAKIAEGVNSPNGKYILIMMFAASFICWMVGEMILPTGTVQKEEKRTKKYLKDKKQFALQLIGIVMIVGAVVYLGSTVLGYQKSRKEYDALEEIVFYQEAEEETSFQDEENSFSEEDKRILEGIGRLHEENPQVIGWILFDGLEISYPIMQGEDNEYYLNHSFSKEENKAGSIFMEASNSKEFEDSHTIIYGHNMKDQSMFGSLKKLKNKNIYEENKGFMIYTLDQVYRYNIFSYYDVSMYSDVYNNQFGPDDYFQLFLDQMVKNSYYDTGIHPVREDKIITLSTCSTEGNRFVVHGVRAE